MKKSVLSILLVGLSTLLLQSCDKMEFSHSVQSLTSNLTATALSEMMNDSKQENSKVTTLMVGNYFIEKALYQCYDTDSTRVYLSVLEDEPSPCNYLNHMDGVSPYVLYFESDYLIAWRWGISVAESVLESYYANWSYSQSDNKLEFSKPFAFSGLFNVVYPANAAYSIEGFTDEYIIVKCPLPLPGKNDGAYSLIVLEKITEEYARQLVDVDCKKDDYRSNKIK